MDCVGIEIDFQINVVYMCVLGWRSDICFENCFRMMGVGWGLDVFGKLVCVHCCWAWDWTFTLEIIVQCWDWTDDLTFMMDVVFVV